MQPPCLPEKDKKWTRKLSTDNFSRGFVTLTFDLHESNFQMTLLLIKENSVPNYFKMRHQYRRPDPDKLEQMDGRMNAHKLKWAQQE